MTVNIGFSPEPVQGGALYHIEPTNIVLTPAQLAAVGSQPMVEQSPALRASAGVGVSWKSPVGPVRLDLALPIRKEAFDKTQIFRVSFGTRF
jgi:outer membrane protein assembly factor BamA